MREQGQATSLVGGRDRIGPTLPMAERGVGGYEDNAIRFVKVETPPFDGQLDTKLFLD